MAFPGDVRTILHPRSAVTKTVQRLIESAERAAPITLSLRESSNLLTVLRAATRIAEAVADNPLVQGAHRDAITALQYELRQTTEAWDAAERALWRKDLEQR